MEKIIAALAFFSFFSNAYSNNADSISLSKNTEITDTTYKCTVITTSKNKYPGVHLFGLGDSSVKILTSKFSREIQIKDIKSIKFKGGGFWRGAAIGGGTAFLLGFLPYMIFSDTSSSSQENNNNLFLGGIGVGAALALPFALIGGLIGQKDKEYDLRKLDFSGKRNKVKDLIKEYSNR